MSADEVMKEVKTTAIITRQFVESHLYLLQWYILARLFVASSVLSGITHFRQDVFGDINQVALGWGLLGFVVFGILGMLRGKFLMNFTFASGALFFSLFMSSKYMILGKFEEIMLYLFLVDVSFAFWLQVRLLMGRANA